MLCKVCTEYWQSSGNMNWWAHKWLFEAWMFVNRTGIVCSRRLLSIVTYNFRILLWPHLPHRSMISTKKRHTSRNDCAFLEDWKQRSFSTHIHTHVYTYTHSATLSLLFKGWITGICKGDRDWNVDGANCSGLRELVANRRFGFLFLFFSFFSLTKQTSADVRDLHW